MKTKIYSFNQERDKGWSVVFDATENLAHDVPLARALQSVIMHHARICRVAVSDRDRQICESEETTSLFLELFHFGLVNFSGAKILRLVR